MARRASNPGEHLAEELEALDMSAAELARQLKVPTNRVTEILKGQRADFRRHRATSGSLFRNEPTVLAEPSERPISPSVLAETIRCDIHLQLQ
jgi:hypothetical protein